MAFKKKMTLENSEVHDLVKNYDEVVLVLQGGGALGSYQAGVFEGLFESNIEPDWITGISIGALNTAIIAGNRPEDRLKSMKGFWHKICKTNSLPLNLSFLSPYINGLNINFRKFVSAFSATRTIFEGQNGFFTPRRPLPLPFINSVSPDEISYYKINELKETLLEFVNFDLINSKKIRVSVGAVNVKTGNFVYFDNTKEELKPEHFMASGALPPGFPAVEINGEYYWDGGLVSNTPLTEILEAKEKKDRLIFQIDLWSARGRLPENFYDVEERTKDIQYSSKTRMVTDMMEKRHERRKMIKELIKLIPEKDKKNNHWCQSAENLIEDGVTNIIQMIYRDKSFEGHYKDYEFSYATMHEHWSSGLTDIRETLKNKMWFTKPDSERGFITHDIHRGN
jgi:NTE family protein